MIKFSSEEVFKILQSMGLSGKDCVADGIVKDIYTALGIDPKITNSGIRVMTPYEILQTPPVFVHGKERPIVFAIKHKDTRAKLGTYDGVNTTFYYKVNKNKEEQSLLETLKSGYRRAVFLGDDESAKNYLDMIETVTRGGAKEFVDSFFDYTKYYKRMKKQLIVDLFAHFFLMYIYKSIKSVKKGVSAKNKAFKPYGRENEEYSEYEQDGLEQMGVVPDIASIPEAFGLSNIEKVTISDFDNETLHSFDFSKTEEKPYIESKMPEERKPLTIEQIEEQMANEQKRMQQVEQLQPEPQKPEPQITQNEIDELAPKLFGNASKSFLRKRDKFFAKHMGMPSQEDEIQEEINEVGYAAPVVENVIPQKPAKHKEKNKKFDFEQNMEI